MEIEGRTAVFYGDLIEAAMDKDMKRMVKLVDSLNNEQLLLLNTALGDVISILGAVVKVRINGN